MSERDDQQGQRPAEDALPRPIIRPRPVPRERNRVFAIMLIGFAALVLLTVLALSALFHYVDLPRVLEGL